MWLVVGVCCVDCTSARASCWTCAVKATCGYGVWVITVCLSWATTLTVRLVVLPATLYTRSIPVPTLRSVHTLQTRSIPVPTSRSVHTSQCSGRHCTQDPSQCLHQGQFTLHSAPGDTVHKIHPSAYIKVSSHSSVLFTPPQSPFDHLWAMICSRARGNIARTVL